MRSILSLFVAMCAVAAPAVKVSVVAERGAGPAVQHGLKKLKLALREKKLAFEEVAELKRARGEIRIIAALGAGAPESLAIQRTVRNGKPALVVSGGDDRGLMYALLEVAERIGWAADPSNPLSEVKDVREQPAVGERALSMYTMSHSHFESYFYNQDYWARYFDLVAKNRFNSFALLFAYEAAGYFAPAYPYFLDVEGFPDVRVAGLSAEQQRRNLDTLNRIIRMAHERGLNFTAGLWDHIYRGGVQGPTQLAEKPTPGLVWGLNEKNLTAYITAALERFLLAAENAAKGVLALVAPVGATHDPAVLLRRVLSSGAYPSSLEARVMRMAKCAVKLGWGVHVETDYGDYGTMQTPWELFGEADARGTLGR